MKTEQNSELPLLSSLGIAPGRLPENELHVLKLLAKGYEPDAISDCLKLSYRTVRHHTQQLCRRAGVDTLIALQAKLGTLQRIRLSDGRVRFGTKPTRASTKR